jgi:hypothetical protein
MIRCLTFLAMGIAEEVQETRWLLAGMHLSPIGGPPPFAPPQS